MYVCTSGCIYTVHLTIETVDSLLLILMEHMFFDSGKKKKRGTRAVAGDKSGRGLRQFSMKGDWKHFFFICFLRKKKCQLKDLNFGILFSLAPLGSLCYQVWSWCCLFQQVLTNNLPELCHVMTPLTYLKWCAVCEKVESKGRTTYNEVWLVFIFLLFYILIPVLIHVYAIIWIVTLPYPSLFIGPFSLAVQLLRNKSHYLSYTSLSYYLDWESKDFYLKLWNQLSSRPLNSSWSLQDP